METVLQDFRYAVRSLLRTPGFTAVAVLTIGLGVGATTSVFSVLNGVLLSPLPYPMADRLVVPLSMDRATGDQWSVAYADYLDWRASDVFSHVAVYQQVNLNVTGEGEPERLEGAQVTEDFFATIGMAPVLGRLLRPDEFNAGAPRLALISFGLWQRRFGGARDVIGKTVRMRGAPVEIVGVMPREMGFPADVDLWFALSVNPENRADFERRDNYVFSGIARLSPSATLEMARAELARLALRVEREQPRVREGVTVTAEPLTRWIVGEDLPRALWVFLGAVAFVLLIGCVNIANLLLSRAATRSREFAVRSALGGSRSRLVRQLLTESLVLALAGGVLGVLVSYWGTSGLLAIAPSEVPRLENVRINATVLCFAVAVSVLSTLLFGLTPALHASAQRLNALSGEDLRTTSGIRGRRVRDALVACELALSLVLLIGAGLLLRSFDHLRDTDPGFRMENLLTFGLSLQGERYDSNGVITATYRELRRGLEEIPGVRSVAAVSALPLGGGGFYLGRSFLSEGQMEPPAGQDMQAMWTTVSPGYFGTMGIPLLTGRDFTDVDDASSLPVLIVNREFARRMFSDGDAIAKRVRSWRDENVYREIVGVTDDVRYFGASDSIRPLVYVPHEQDDWRTMVMVVRTATEPGAVIRHVRAAIKRVDPDLALADIQTMEQVMSVSVASGRFAAVLLSGFALTALLLATVGVYGVLSYLVVQRTREIGVRMAVGAQRSDVLRMVIGEAATVVLIGTALGVAGALLLTRLIQPLLYDVSSSDPATFAAVAVLLSAVALAASYFPARQATLVDPMIAIRAE